MASSAGEKKDEAVLTTGWGAPVADNMNSMSAGKLGPLLLQVSVCVCHVWRSALKRCPPSCLVLADASLLTCVRACSPTQDVHLIDKLAHFDRERIPERVVHAKGAGAHGYFEVTHDISQYCKAKVFDTVGKRTPVFTRFSTVGGEKGR